MLAAMKLLKVEEVAEIARTSPSTVRYWISTGKLKSIRPGRRRLVEDRELKRFLFGRSADRSDP